MIKPKTFIDFDKQYYISLTEKCNWKCEYCDFPNKQIIKTTPINEVILFFDMLKKITNSDNKIEYCLEGGEIGLLSEEYLDEVFKHDLTQTYNISTNGLFMKKGYHIRYKDKIHYILYHVTPEFNNNFEVERFKFDKSILVYYTIVITKENLNKLNDFLEYNSDLLFQPHILQPRKEDLNFLSKDDFIKLDNILKSKENVTDHFKERITRIIDKCEDEKWLNDHRLLCANVYTQPIFDLPNKKINRCCISITGDNVDLNEENLKKLYLNQKLFKTKIDKVCDGCIANFLWHDFRHKKYFKNVINILKEF